MASDTSAPRTSAAALAAVAGVLLGGLLLLGTALLPFARLGHDLEVLDGLEVRARFGEASGWVLLAVALATLALPVLALVRRDPLWLLGAAVPALLALGFTTYWLLVRLPDYAQFGTTVDLAAGGMCCFAAGPVLVAALFPALAAVRTRLHALTGVRRS